MARKYTIRTAQELYEAMMRCQDALEFTSEGARAILNKASYEVLKKYVLDYMLFPKCKTSGKEEEKREWIIDQILLLFSHVIAVYAPLIEEKYKRVPETSFETVTDAETAIKALAKAETREEMKCILESLSYEELEKVEKGSLAEFVKKTNLIDLIISYVEYSKSVNSGGCVN